MLPLFSTKDVRFSSIQVEEKCLHVLGEQTDLRTQCAHRYPMPVTHQDSLWRAQQRLHETNHCLEGRKVCQVETGCHREPRCSLSHHCHPWLSAVLNSHVTMRIDHSLGSRTYTRFGYPTKGRVPGASLTPVVTTRMSPDIGKCPQLRTTGLCTWANFLPS